MKRESDYNAPTKVKVASVVSSIAGTGLATLYLAKGKFKNIPNLEMGVKDAFIISSGSIVGGLTGGLLSDEKSQAKYKLRESSNQLIGNTIIPLVCLATVNKITKPLHKGLRAVIAVTTLIGSTFIGHNIADKVNDKVFEEKRNYKIGVKDFITDFDDLLFATSTVMNNKPLYRLTACICPFTYSNLGMMAGMRHKEEKDDKTLDIKI